MRRFPLEVSLSGAVLLGNKICCDGFHRDFKVRVQTHVHDDHMDGFDTSKGFQDILLSEPTRKLLVAEFDADLDFRENIRVVKLGVRQKVNDEHVTLLSSGHTLGGVQVAAELSSRVKVGYSGDFQWPLEKVIQVDALVVDSTYGSPKSIRKYSQADAEARLLELVTSKLKHGPVHILSHRGTLQRALQLFSTNVNCPLVCSPRLCAEVGVYRGFGYGIGAILEMNSVAGKKVLSGKRYTRFYGKGDGFPVELQTGTTITLSAFMTQPHSPVMQFSDRSFTVALSNHADFNGTLEYIVKTGASYVVTDNTRGGHAVELAQEIRSQLGIEARPSASHLSHEWGL